jgi:hypothetical protein
VRFVSAQIGSGRLARTCPVTGEGISDMIEGIQKDWRVFSPESLSSVDYETLWSEEVFLFKEK